MSFENPTSILFDTKGVELAVSNSQVLDTSLSGSETNAGILMAGSGSDGKVRFLKSDTDGTLFVTGAMNIVGPVDVGLVDQGDQGTIGNSWYVSMTDGTNVIGVDGQPIFITGSVDTQGPDGTAEEPITITGSVVLGEQPISVTGSLTITADQNPTATVTQLGASLTNITLLAANADRRGATFFYEGTKVLFLKLGATATDDSYTVKLSAGGYYEVPASYTGIIDGIWNSVAGGDNNVLVTEILD